MAEVKPTRSELIKLKEKVKLAHTGHSLLKRKKDGLIQEFFKIMADAKDTRTLLTRAYRDGLGKIALTQAVEGTAAVESASFASRHEPRVKLGTKNLMGVPVPRVEASFARQRVIERGYGVLRSSSYLDDTVTAFETVVERALESAEKETALRRMLIEIEKTKRRVNALEYIVIPGMEKTAAFIRLRLEELERENIFRLKRVKKKGAS